MTADEQPRWRPDDRLEHNPGLPSDPGHFPAVPLPAPPVTDDAAARDYAHQQIAAADHGQADNQCPSCHRYRTDGQRLQAADHAGTCTAHTPPPPPMWRTCP